MANLSVGSNDEQKMYLFATSVFIGCLSNGFEICILHYLFARKPKIDKRKLVFGWQESFVRSNCFGLVFLVERYIYCIYIFLVSVRIFEYKIFLTSSRNISKRRFIRDFKTTYKQFANDGLFNRFISRVSTKLLILSSIYRLCCISINVYYVQVFFKAFVFRQKYHAA